MIVNNLHNNPYQNIDQNWYHQTTPSMHVQEEFSYTEEDAQSCLDQENIHQSMMSNKLEPKKISSSVNKLHKHKNIKDNI